MFAARLQALQLAATEVAVQRMSVLPTRVMSPIPAPPPVSHQMCPWSRKEWGCRVCLLLPRPQPGDSFCS